MFDLFTFHSQLLKIYPHLIHLDFVHISGQNAVFHSFHRPYYCYEFYIILNNRQKGRSHAYYHERI